MTLKQLKEEMLEFFKEKGLYIYNIDAQIEMGLEYVPEVHVQLDAYLKEDRD